MCMWNNNHRIIVLISRERLVFHCGCLHEELISKIVLDYFISEFIIYENKIQYKIDFLKIKAWILYYLLK